MHRHFGECRRRKCENIQSKMLNILKYYFKLFSPVTQIQPVAHSEHPNKILRARLCTTTSAHLALLAHVASHNMTAVSDTFKQRNVPPPSRHPRNPNMNENRSHNMLGPLRSPPPAAN